MNRKNQWIWIVAMLGLLMLMGRLDDGLQVEKDKQAAYCQRVAAGVHTNYDHIDCEVKP